MPKKQTSNKNGKTATAVAPEEVTAWEPVKVVTSPEETGGWGVGATSQGIDDNLQGMAEAEAMGAPTDEWNAAVVASDEAEEELPTDADEWNSAAAPLMLNIRQHAGVFNKETPKILIYGDTGTQKSRTASTFPNAIFADIDHGMSSVTEQVDTVWIDDNQNGYAQLKELYEFLRRGEHDYETVVLDTLNEMQRVIMRFTVDEYKHVRRSYGNLPGQSDYGKMLYEFLELTRDFISLPMKVVLLAQVNAQQFDTDILGPQLVGKNSAKEISRKMDVIGYIYKAMGENDQTFPEIAFDSAQYATKDRSFKLPAVLDHPTFDRMYEYWNA